MDPKGLLTPSDNYYFGHDWTKETDPWVNYPRQPDSGWTWRGRQEACTISLEALALVMGVTPGGQGFALALGGGLLAIHILEATGTIKPLSSTPENDIPAFIEYPGEGPVLYDCQCQACKLLRKNGGRVQKKFK